MDHTADIAPRNWLMIALLGLIWGSSFMFISIAIREYGPLTVAGGRIFLAAVFLVGFVQLTGRGLPKWNGEQGKVIWASALAMGFLSNAVPFFLLSWAQNYVASGFAGVSMAAVPLLVLPLAHFMVPGERMYLRKTAGFLLGFSGVVVLIGLKAFQSLGNDMEGVARLACLAASGCYAIGAIITRLCPKVDIISLAAATLLCAAICIVPVALITEGIPQINLNIPTLAIVFLGLFPTALAQFLLVVVIRDAGPGFFALTNYQVPVWSVFLGALVLSEPLPATLIIALALILSGVAISQYGALSRLFRRSS